MIQVSMNFKNEFDGELQGKNGKVHIGSVENSMAPYELLAGALGACLYSTYLDIIKKMRLDLSSCSLSIDIEKRTEVPTTAKLVVVNAVIVGASEKHEKYTHAFELATKHCSIYNTLSQIAEMQWTLDFK